MFFEWPRTTRFGRHHLEISTTLIFFSTNSLGGSDRLFSSVFFLDCLGEYYERSAAIFFISVCLLLKREKGSFNT